ncbi:hypothetical protein, partial [uncultured Meiothermus sp.]|uniref:hypothetical protein n=1 Tax=uncultured Meiothermus sp. TaxID=157471 RepID=UPI0026392270
MEVEGITTQIWLDGSLPMGAPPVAHIPLPHIKGGLEKLAVIANRKALRATKSRQYLLLALTAVPEAV